MKRTVSLVAACHCATCAESVDAVSPDRRPAPRGVTAKSVTDSTMRSNSRARRTLDCMRGEPPILPYRCELSHGQRPRPMAMVITVGPFGEKPKPLVLSHFARYRWFIREAMEAAPNPLSMLTTDTPAAQLLSIPSSAAMPPKL